ncbi:MAG: bifunctional glutamate N-acetyltransferase/amino-acid acetyltransferase ArgJ [Hyphomonas sp.]|uniref:bifunctional glutamate N-acetyltransferase/amino-acid acetyltransferase ArgJ n=1 Tax=Hyphomonas sp. TaxID=87 RepID=UPI0017F4CCB0|nr:bifunctional glutamate N-acetyltransferase/amino-acid acetyltransferase ArgJ [Hyphomonas sp.]MBU3921184.1 bifunctional glutamate N-acetyltransferase/amino-acid acetyltransferase ArgJ [Alphaproteobacteria bacterium]MBA3070316.1 bifunctional glutamate N-acetyltransferase/amino-acid acetyltransferase ArgJ [Hyphomonas sp.]MBU4062802.1 bifunctional glutamate N-acetyltransferase/amino-acid acetyltransferase ArgJ [Alphaproteobacteria bacterium]MBU4163721.1 bifunctional glutamate N-acetyltransferase
MKLTPSPFAPRSFPALPDVKGLRAAAGSRGFYARRGIERDDVFLFVFDEGTTCAGVYTVSNTASADVRWCREALSAGGGKARALVAHSGNSNAFTGPKGVEKNEATLKALTQTLGVPKSACFLAATGVIGEPLADPNFVGAFLPGLAGRLGPPDWEACARAFMTTDTFPKASGRTVDLAGVPTAFAGIAKGSGMIMPNMATMLSYVFTDAAIAPALLQDLLADITRVTFNAITVDGDTSTSDTLMVFATGASGAPPIETRGDARFAGFAAALHATCLDLALQVVKDGEGASKFVTVRVEGAVSELSAKTVACHIANSPLIKTAMAAGDANWGRVVMAVGKSLEPIVMDELAIWFDDVQVAKGGARAPDYDEAAASAVFARPEFTIRVHLGVDAHAATVWTCDLTHGYVDINGAYRT